MDSWHSLGCKLELPAIGELLITTIMPLNKALFSCLKGADDCEYNYVEVGFDPHDKSYLILCWCCKGGNQLFFKDSWLWSEITLQSNRVTDTEMCFLLHILLEEQTLCRWYFLF